MILCLYTEFSRACVFSEVGILTFEPDMVMSFMFGLRFKAIYLPVRCLCGEFCISYLP